MLCVQIDRSFEEVLLESCEGEEVVSQDRESCRRIRMSCLKIKIIWTAYKNVVSRDKTSCHKARASYLKIRRSFSKISTSVTR